MTTTFALPVPVVRPQGREWDGKTSRTLKVDFLLGEPVETPGKTEQTLVQVSVHHHGDRKQFFAVANQMTRTVEADSPFTTEAFWAFNGVTLATEPVARYNAKALVAFRDKVLAAFPAYVQASEKLQSLFTETGGQPR